MNVPTRPVLRWHGGKWMLAPWIISQMPPHRVYVEPFGGAASVLMRKPRAFGEVYNDLDDEVVNLFRVLRSGAARRLIEMLELTPFASAEFFEAYEPASCEVERARRTVVKSFMGFGSNAIHRASGFRAVSNQTGTAPGRDWANYPVALRAVVERLRGVIIMNRDAREVMAAHDAPGTLHYVDPPYVLGTRADGYADYAHEMTDAQHADLLAFLRGLKGKVILSGYHCDLYDDALGDWTRLERAALADGARKRTEIIWCNFAHEGVLL